MARLKYHQLVIKIFCYLERQFRRRSRSMQAARSWTGHTKEPKAQFESFKLTGIHLEVMQTDIYTKHYETGQYTYI